MLGNSVKSFLFHVVICIATAIITLSLGTKITIEFGLINLFLYFLFGKLYLKKLDNSIKEIFSISPIFIIGSLLFFVFTLIQLKAGVWVSHWFVINVFLASMGPSMVMLGEALNIKFVYLYLPFSLVPCLFMWLGLKSKKI
jgi:hypothetical protein